MWLFSTTADSRPTDRSSRAAAAAAAASGQPQSKLKRGESCSEKTQDSPFTRESSVRVRLLQGDDRGIPSVDEAVCLGIPKSIHVVVITPEEEHLLRPAQNRGCKQAE